jgi:hypothetical protein
VNPAITGKHHSSVSGGVEMTGKKLALIARQRPFQQPPTALLHHWEAEEYGLTGALGTGEARRAN